MQCSVAVSEQPDPQKAAKMVSHSLRKDLGDAGCDIAFFFVSPHFLKDLDQMVETIHAQLHPVTLIGCMGDGVIGGHQEFEEGPALCLWGLAQPGIRSRPFRLSTNISQDPPRLEGWPEELNREGDPLSCILLADPLTTPIHDLLGQFDQAGSGFQVIGGFAGGGGTPGDNRLILNHELVDTGAVGVVIHGGIRVKAVVSQGCRPIGERYVVTKADQNVLYELGGSSPIERLEATIQALPALARKQALMGVQVGIAMDEYRSDFTQGDFLIRGLLGANRKDGSLVVGDMLQEGQTIQFHIRDNDAASGDLNRLLLKEQNPISGGPPSGALLFSCNGRGQRFFGSPHHDISKIQERLGPIPIAGFFAGGEFGPVGGKNFLHGYTASMALFYEH
ncbi:MAG: FIST N-terminal domain-containing protein [Nitrospirales bacterium]